MGAGHLDVRKDLHQKMLLEHLKLTRVVFGCHTIHLAYIKKHEWEENMEPLVSENFASLKLF
jgi:hypothetical protein